ncbi:MAG: HAMP domain-containing histidine kinase [Betaproteobacteria bacterium]|nr:HAMP domain-containing histidine kinase [Betaproteobacteria bacterium]
MPAMPSSFIASSLLHRLVALRRLSVLAQGLVLLLAIAWLKMPLAIGPLIGITVSLALFNLITQWRLQQARPVSDDENLAQLLVDVAALGGLLYFSGGSANPFVSLFLVPITIAATALPARHAWFMAGATTLVYTFLMFWNLPLPPPQGQMAELDVLVARASGVAPEHAGHASGFALHILGMWLNFVVSAAIVALFLTRMAATLKAREKELASAREAALRNEQILTLGTLAAGAAHKLGTPLSTMAVVLREAELAHGDNAELRADMQLLRAQVEECKKILSQTLASAGQARDEASQQLPLDAYLERLLEEWRLIRPRASIRETLEGPRPAPQIATDRTLEQALLNLLDNAADASPDGLEFSARWDASSLVITILDHGPGIDQATAARIGEAFFSTKQITDETSSGGLGIGFFLTNATLERFGGRVQLTPRESGGTCTRVTLPLSRLCSGPT